MQLCIGRLPFLVCAPYFHRFFTLKNENSSFFFEDGVPSALNKLLSLGKIHLAPASSFNYALHPEKFVLYSKLCTSCNLEVYSVRLYSHLPMEELSGCPVHFTPNSATSVALLKVLFALRFRINPIYIDSRPYDPLRDKARLLIGDEALLQNKRSDFPFVYDLGSLWKDWQGLPFVFGAWSIRQEALEPELKESLSVFLDEVNLSVADFRRDFQTSLSTWKSHYPVASEIDGLESYFDSLDYSFTDERKKSLALFFEKCHEIGLLKQIPEMKYWSP